MCSINLGHSATWTQIMSSDPSNNSPSSTAQGRQTRIPASAAQAYPLPKDIRHKDIHQAYPGYPPQQRYPPQQGYPPTATRLPKPGYPPQPGTQPGAPPLPIIHKATLSSQVTLLKHTKKPTETSTNQDDSKCVKSVLKSLLLSWPLQFTFGLNVLARI